MVKFVVYTSNMPSMPKDMEEVINFAKEQNKFRIASVELNHHLSDIKVGDNVITKKGNSIFIIKTIDESLDEINQETRDYLENLTRNYGLKKVGITSVANIVRFETWCKSSKPIINSSKTTKMTTKNFIKSFASRLKSMFMPVEAEGVRIATDGNICVATSQGYVAIDNENNLTSYPEELTLDLPVFIISKPKEQLSVGDVIALDHSYAKVTKINGSKITAIGYTGAGKTVHTIKDFLFNQTMVRVVVSLAGNIGGQINPMLMLAMSDKSDKKDLLPLMMMSQNSGSVGMNPMMLMALTGGEDTNLKDMFMMSALMGNTNLFGGLLNSQPAPRAQKVPTEKPVEDTEVADVPNENVSAEIDE